MSKSALSTLLFTAAILACQAPDHDLDLDPGPRAPVDAAEVGARRTVLLAFLEPGENWPAGNPLEHPLFPEHAAYMTLLLDNGVITRGGPFADLTGALLEFVENDPAEAALYLDEEPFVLAGVWTYTLRPWLLAVEVE